MVNVAPSLDFAVVHIGEVHERKTYLCALAGTDRVGASNEHDAKIFFCDDIPIASRHALRLRPNDNVRSVLACSQKLTPVGEIGQQCDLSLNNRNFHFHNATSSQKPCC